MENIIKQIFSKQTELSELIRSTDFSRALLGTLAMVIPILLGISFELISYAIPMTVGVLLVFPSDTKGSFRLKTRGIFFSAIVSALTIFIIGIFKSTTLWIVPVIGILTFCISYISIYGFRASLVSFSGLMALVLGLANLADDTHFWQSSLLIGLGGIWYLLLTYIYYLIFPKRIIEESIGHSLKLTAKYLNIRRKLIDPNEDRDENLGKLIQLQTQLTESFETLREMLMAHRKRSGESVYLSVRLMVFIQLVEILEIAVSNPVDYDKQDELFMHIPEAKDDFQNLIFQMETQLSSIALNLSNPEKIKSHQKAQNLIEIIENNIGKYESKQKDNFDDYLLILKNYIKYLKQQLDMIIDIKQFLVQASPQQLNEVRKKDLTGFVSKTNYDRELLKENFSFKSPIFRHSLRISVVMTVATIIGLIADPLNYYWVLMTIIVIMRPNYGLTKKRITQRTTGTIIGAVLALLIIFITQNLVVYGIVATVSMVFALAWLQRNYSTAAIFVTTCVLFVYALLTPDILDLIQFRLIDTAIGVGLAIIGNLWLWPSWEIKSMGRALNNTIHAQRKYLLQISDYYNKVGEVSQEYRLSRKKAFLSISNLNAAFQRMSQEPKFKQNQTVEIYELILLSQSFLAASASLGTYTINNPTTPASKNFNQIISFINNNLMMAEQLIKEKESGNQTNATAEEIISNTYGNNLKQIFEDRPDSVELIEEAHLVLAQLKWLLEISMKINDVLRKSKNIT